jgi:glycosyltransferase involved in cell wall biosynthesis
MFPAKAFKFKPEFICKSAWHKHAPFGYYLICELKPKIFVELGVHNGDSFFTFCQSRKENNLSTICYGIDTWSGDVHSGFYGSEIFENVRSYNHANYSNFSYLIKSTFETACVQFEENSIGLLHIDGLHTYESVKSDFENWFPKVENEGLILFHDVRERKKGFGVWKLWDELKGQFPSFLFDFGSGLGVLQKSKNLDCVKISDNFILDSRKSSEIQESFLKAHELIDLNLRLSLSEKKLNNVSSQKVIMEKKVESIQSSFSWKFTAPFRFFRRTLLDPFFNKRRASFDPKMYLKLNPDLYRIVGSDLEAARSHFYNFGLKQGRRFKKPQIKSYAKWIDTFDSDCLKDVTVYEKRSSKLVSKPLISIIMPVFNPSVGFLKEAIESVLDQVYHNWELCIVNDGSNSDKISDILANYSSIDSRIIVQENEHNMHISFTSNRAAKMSKGQFIAFLDHDDLLRPHSLLRVVETFNENNQGLIIYSDEDKIDHSGSRSDPYFKPDWNPDLLFSQNYLCHFLVIDKTLFWAVGGFREGFEGSQDWDLVLRASNEIGSEQIIHIPEILYHWRIHKDSVSQSVSAKNYAIDSAVLALNHALEKRNIQASVDVVQTQYLRAKRKITADYNKPLVSIIIPTRDNGHALSKCLETIRDNTDYQNFEILIIDNDSEDPETINSIRTQTRYSNHYGFKFKGPFNYSAINNFGASKANGECLVLLNDDVEIINSEWLEELLVNALRPEIGAVGAKLFYPDGTIQHAGILIGYCKVAGEIGKGMPNDWAGQMQRANLVQNVSAVTGACLAIEKTKFLEVGGLDEQHFKVAFNDVDLCLKLLEAGYRNLYTPFAKLIHHESMSRGQDTSPAKKNRFVKEADHMKRKWKKYITNDPAYNPNLSLYADEQFEIAIPPRLSHNMKK